MNLLSMIDKRHPPPGWIVVRELPNGTGGSASRRADAFALGIWPSHQFATHLYEIKVSRSDVQRELKDPSKADAIGKYADYIWFVVDDLKIIDGLVIPDSFGVLYPKNQVLRVHRKAPKLKAREPNRSFVAAIVRHAMDNYVPKHEHDTFKATARETVKTELERDRKWQQESMNYDLDRLKKQVASFEEASGITITGDASWELPRIGAAVKALVLAAKAAPNRPHYELVEELVKQQLGALRRDAARHDEAAAAIRRAHSNLALQIRHLLEPLRKAAPDGEQLSTEELAAWAQKVDTEVDALLKEVG